MIRIQKISLLSVLLLVTTFVNAQVNAQELTYRLVDGTQLEVYNDNNTHFSGGVVIPEEASYYGNMYPVKGIAPNAFANSTELISISIPSSVKTIGEGAFDGCVNLKIARFATIKDLCGMTFAKGNSNPLSLSTHLYIGESEYEVTTLDIPDDVETINNFAFAGGANITNIYLPKNLKSIGNDVFSGCKGFVVYYDDFNQMLDIDYGTGSSNPMSLATVKLKNASLSDEIHIERNVKDRTFQGAKWLKTLIIESGVTSIGQYAFIDCVNMTSVTLPASLTSIGESAFQHCSSLTEVTIPGAIGIEIARNAFRSCTSLEKATVNAPLATLPEGLFRDCTSLNTVNLPKATQTIGLRTFNNTSLTSLPLPEEGGEGLKTIGEYAFAACKIQSLVIPSTVLTINNYAFVDCANLSDITISERGETPLAILENVFCYSKDKYGTYPPLPNLEHIYSYAKYAPSASEKSFLSQKSIQLVYPTPEDPEKDYGYNNIPWSGFTKSTIGYHTITYLVDNTEYKQFSQYAGQETPSADDPVKEGWHFEGWMEDIPELMPNNDLEIHGYFTKKHTTTDGVEYMLSSGLQKEAKVIGCSNPTQVTIPASVEFGGDSYKVVGIDARAFKEATTLTAVDLSQATYLTSIGNAVFAGCTALESVIWSDNLSEIKDSMFVECKALSTFEIPATVTAIGNWAFCKSGITAITLSKNITEMGARIFQSCSSLGNVVFDQGMNLPQLPEFMFYECKNLTIFPTLPSSTTRIGKSAFEKCSGLSSLDLNEAALTIISNQAFYSCGALKSITLPATLQSLGSKAFSSCQSVEKITINRSNDQPDPPAKEDDSFSQTVYDGASLYVTDVNMYESIDTWNLFKKIYPIDPLELPAEELEITLDEESYQYKGVEIKPVPTVKRKIEGQEILISADEYTVSYTDSINVGTATLTIRDKDGGNYIITGSVSKTYKITPKPGSLAELIDKSPSPANDKITYNANPQNLIIAGTFKKGITGGFKGTLKYSLDKDNIAFDTAIPQGEDAKDYTVYYMVEGDPNYTASDTLSLTVTIHPRPTQVSSITLEKNSYEYDGTAKEPTVASVKVSFGSLEIDSKEYKVSYDNNVNATNKDSKAQVIISDSIGGNFIIEKSKSTPFEITPAKGKLDNLLTQKPTGIDKLSYTGEAQDLITAGTINKEKAKDGILKYSLDNKAFDTAIPQGIKAQTYTVYYKVEDDPNYTPSDTAHFDVTIKAQEISISAENITLEKESYEYDGTARKPGVTVKIGETIISAEEYTVSYADSINAGTATVTVTAKNDGNYDFASVSKTYEITRKPGSLAEFINDPPKSVGVITYDTKPHNLIKAGTFKKAFTSGFKGILKYSLDKDNIAFDAAIPQGEDAKDYTVYYMVEGDPNYTPSDTLSLTVKIDPRPTQVSSITLEQNSYEYDGTAKKPAVNSVTVKYNNNNIDSKEYTVSYQDSINAGTAKVIITAKEGGNYSFESKTTTFVITPAKGKLDNLLTQKPIGIDKLSFTGEAQDLITAGTINKEKAKDGILKYSLDNKAFADAIPQGTKAQTYTVYYKVEDDPNYTPSDTAHFDVTIKAQEISISAENITLEKESYEYDGTARKPGVTVKIGETIISAEEYTVSYADSINAGTAKVIVTAKKGSNYNFASVSKTYKITPVASSLTKDPTAKTGIIYSGTDQDLINAGTSNTGKVQYSLSKDEKTFSETIPTGKNAGDYTVYYRVKGDANHSDSEIGSVKATIAPKEITSFSLSQSSYTYAGSEIKPDVNVEFNKQAVSKDEYTVSYSNNKNVGTATVTLTDKEGGNFKVSGSKTFAITQAALTISADNFEIFEGEAIPEFTVKYDGFVNNETEAALTKKPILRCNAIVGSKPGDYTINVSGAESANYRITYKNGKLTILVLKFVAGGETSKDEDDPANYQITSTGKEEGTTPTVSIIDDKDAGGAFAIPETVSYGNKTFTVTEIGESAFASNKNLTEVTIPSSITGIGDKAFKDCSNLKAIMVYITTPISLAVAGTRGGTTRAIGTSVFDGVNKNLCILYVPDESVELYKVAPVWKEFLHIVPLSTIATGISGITVTDDEPFDIYNLRGQKVKSKATNLEGLPRGVYIINGRKVAVK